MPDSKNRNIGIPRNVSTDNFRVSKSGGKIKLFAKYNNKWYATPLQDAFDINNLNQARKHSIVTYNNGSGELNPAITAEPNGKLSIRDNKSDSKIVIKNDSGVLQIRNSRDDEDAVLKAKTLKLPSVSPTPEIGDFYYDSSAGGHIVHGVGLGINSFSTATGDDQSATLAVISKGDGDSVVKFLTGGSNRWSLGNDGSDSNKFKINNGDSLEDDSLLDLDTSGNVSIDGTMTAGGFTTTGTWTFDTSAGGTTGITQINVGSAFTDNDTTLMSAGAIKEKIESYGYSTSSGDITGVTITTDSGGGSAASDTGGSADFSILGANGVGVTNSGTTITAAAIPGEIDHDSLNNFVANEHIDWTASSAGTIHASNYSQPTNYVTNDADDTMVGALTIDKNTSGDGAENATGFQVDFDRTVASSGTNAHNDIGIDLDVNSASLGTSSVKGMDIDVVGATSGTHTATGIELDVSGADDHTGIAITTPDAANGREDIKIMSSANSGDYCSIFTFTNGATTIKTVDADSSDADFSLDADGDITLNSQTGNFVAKKAGTEFSAANSSYAGMILGYTRIQNDGTGTGDALITMDATLSVLQTVAGTDLSVTFKAPPSGNVEIQMIASLYASSKTVELALSDNATFNEVNEIHTYDAGAQSSDETDVNMTTVSFVVTGLTAGSSYTYYIGGAETSSGTSYFRHGRFRTTGTHYPPIIIKAIALPATITTGE